jgi:hypothetical protein
MSSIKAFTDEMNSEAKQNKAISDAKIELEQEQAEAMAKHIEAVDKAVEEANKRSQQQAIAVKQAEIDNIRQRELRGTDTTAKSFEVGSAQAASFLLGAQSEQSKQTKALMEHKALLQKAVDELKAIKEKPTVMKKR